MSRFAHDQLGCSDVVLHGICVGGAAVVLAAAKPDFPGLCLPSLWIEGLFATFLESFKLHMKAEKQANLPRFCTKFSGPPGWNPA